MEMAMHRYNSTKVAAFGSELVMEKVGFGLMEAALGKIMFSNLIGRHGHRIPLAKEFGAEILGLGARAGLQGRPQLSRLTREAIAIAVDPKLVAAYEKAYDLGSAMRKYGPRGVKRMSSVMGFISKIPGMNRIAPGTKETLLEIKDMVDRVPLESTGVRKIVDYAFSSPSQVGKDIHGLLASPFRTKTASEPWNRPNPKERPSPLTPEQKARAKARAKAAGRPYPNLVDNMRARK